jgi:hypothetical protein
VEHKMVLLFDKEKWPDLIKYSVSQAKHTYQTQQAGVALTQYFRNFSQLILTILQYLNDCPEIIF